MSFIKQVLIALSVFLLFTSHTYSQDKHEADIIIYGDASGGVTAAVQASKMGKKVILVSQYGHLGGMSSSGLGWTDIGKDSILGGLSREFYHRLYKHYQKDESWVQEKRKDFNNVGQSRKPALNPETQLASTFEPKVAEAVFDEMAKEAGFKIIKGRIDWRTAVIKEGNKISALKLEDGTLLKGKIFIDASYEGDLLPGAGVSFFEGREANTTYNERGNGNTGPSRKNQLPNGIDPYIVKGDKSSGLLPGVNADMGGEKGDADRRYQAYCYRMVLTTVESNRVMVKKPANYKELEYEILFRTIEAGQKNYFFKTTHVPNKKTDSNNTGGISTDYIGMNYGKDWTWASLSHKEREVLAAKHRDWQLGLIWTLQNHPRVPEIVRKRYANWGLAKDEFTDNGNWPYNIYVREARRMKSDFIMTENHCLNKIPIKDSIGRGAYTLDSHNTQRFVYKGMVKNEGDIQSYLKAPYSISYKAIVPKKNQCENLLVPWALSSTHIAFGSIRMEPVFMILGQSAATAASIAIDKGISVQEVPYDILKKQLLKDGQKL